MRGRLGIGEKRLETGEKRLEKKVLDSPQAEKRD
jgi:hypothetical protein